MRCGWLVSVLIIISGGGCGGGGNTDPLLIPGGGVTGPAIDGKVNVYVVDAFTGAGVQRATVRVGPYDGTKVEGMTDVFGLYVAEGSYHGAQEIDVKAPGYATAVWLGVDGVNVTIPLVDVPTDVEVPGVQLSGTFPADMLAPPANLLTRAATVEATIPHFGPSISAPTFQAGEDSYLCAVRDPPMVTPPCNWSFKVHPGRVVPFARVWDFDFDGNDHLVGVAAAAPIDVTAGVSGIAVPFIPLGDVHALTVSFRAAPAGLTALGGSVWLDFGAGGLGYMGSLRTSARTVEVPGLAALGGATYEVLATAQESGGAGANGWSLLRRGGLTGADLGGEVVLDGWMPPPTNLMFNRMVASFAPVDGAGYYQMQFGSGANPTMIVTVLDGFTLTAPPTDFTPIPAGPVVYSVDAIDVGDAFDPTDFAFRDLDLTLERWSGDSVTVN